MSASSESVVIVDYLRGLAAAMVAWFHCTNAHLDNWVGASGAYGWLGVEIFFVISGFAVTFALQRSSRGPGLRSYLEFMLRRLIRLEPPYIASVLFAVAMLYVSAHMPGFRGAPPKVDLPQLLFHLAYLIPFTRYEWVQPVYWTLTYEFFFYLIGGFLIPLLSLRRGAVLFCVYAVAVAGLALTDIVPVLVLLFVMGIAVCRFRTGRDQWPLSFLVILGSAGVMAICGARLEAVAGLATVVAIAAPLPVSSLPGPIASLLAGLGAISYSLYLVHVPIASRVVNLGSRFAHTPATELAVSLLAFVAACAAAILFHWLVESPAMRAAHRFRLRRSPAEPKAVAG